MIFFKIDVFPTPASPINNAIGYSLGYGGRGGSASGAGAGCSGWGAGD